ncbi:phosphotransferase [Sphingomonas jatrophae]|uniref:Predicted kinase, aminoglycoside phosphotransferase (APT) family n=1 Tax=Sphingomonas jatrophae TaxID=1166337 RepID=A0A1I6KB17_9SPHN|nr:phosphotransferase [Sphingomonas jatrophae]SFR88401.1 Predicted kinase, aminoglycoside phosphotransferase (APT) family [Sphingomonas jatrophae]
MSVAADENIGTVPVRAGYDFDEGALARWMEARIEGFSGSLTVEQFKGGQSNPTYKLTTPGRSYVLRRKPPGQLLRGAHAIEREAQVLQALAAVSFPVARLRGLCTDDSVIGTWFYVMDMVEGRIFWDATVPRVPRAERGQIFDAMNETLATLHQIDPAAVGLDGFGRPGNYFQRQIDRWSRQYLADVDAGRDANMDRLIEWLRANMPADDGASRLIHGDYRIDNIIFDAEKPRILAVLDWELSTVGHPLADFAYHLMMYRMPPKIVAGLHGSDIRRLGIPTEEEYVGAYCRRTGREGVPDLDFYIAFNFFRLAAIFHGIKGRVLRGTAASAQARARVAVLPELMALAWSQTRSSR